MNNENLFCDGCIYLNLTEEEQDKMKVKQPHYCNFHRQIVVHNGRHPHITKVASGCDGPYTISLKY